MSQQVAFADAEDALRRHLTPLIPQASIYAGITPQDLPNLSVTIVRVGGQQRDRIFDDVRISVDCRAASTLSNALALAETVRSLISLAGDEGWIADVSCSGVAENSAPYNNPDPVNPDQYRATAAFSLTLRGTAA